MAAHSTADLRLVRSLSQQSLTMSCTEGGRSLLWARICAKSGRRLRCRFVAREISFVMPAKGTARAKISQQIIANA